MNQINFYLKKENETRMKKFYWFYIQNDESTKDVLYGSTIAMKLWSFSFLFLQRKSLIEFSLSKRVNCSKNLVQLWKNVTKKVKLVLTGKSFIHFFPYNLIPWLDDPIYKSCTDIKVWKKCFIKIDINAFTSNCKPYVASYYDLRNSPFLMHQNICSENKLLEFAGPDFFVCHFYYQLIRIKMNDIFIRPTRKKKLVCFLLLKGYT